MWEIFSNFVVEKTIKVHQRVIISEASKNVTGKLMERLDKMPEDEEFDSLPMHGIQQGDTTLKPKIYYDKIDLTPVNIERMIFVLARIYRNSNICDMENMSDEMFEFIVNGACNLGFMLVNEAKSYATFLINKFAYLKNFLYLCTP